jgi:hypothetical protein
MDWWWWVALAYGTLALVVWLVSRYERARHRAGPQCLRCGVPRWWADPQSCLGNGVLSVAPYEGGDPHLWPSEKEQDQ